MSTPGDLLFHLRARQLSPCFELASQTAWLRGRDREPVGPAASVAVLIDEEDPEFRGGSYVIVQKYLHDLRAWNALPVEDQEKVIGRTKLSNIELDDAVKPGNAYVALTTITDPDGTERQILRDNMPFGTVGQSEFGTYFIGYARSPAVTEKMLENMFLGDPPGNYDRILDFSTPVTSTLFFVPTAEFLDDLPDPPGAAASAEAGANPISSSPDAPGHGRDSSADAIESLGDVGT